MKKISIVIVVILTIITSTKLQSQWAVMSQKADSIVMIGREHIYNCQFEKAEKCFNEVIELDKNQPVGYFLDAMVYYWKLVVYRFTDYYHKPFLDKIDKVIKVCDKNLSKDPGDIVSLFFKGGALGYRGRFYAQNKEWIKAGRDGLEAYNILIQCLNIAPNNNDIMLGTGIYNFYTDAIPEKYPLTKPILSFLTPGDKRLGLLQLESSAKHARYAGVEAEVALLEAYFNFENRSLDAERIVEALYKRYPNNPYFHRYLGKIHVRIGDFDTMESVWRDILLKHMDKKPGYDNLTAREALFYIGWALQKRGDFETSIKYFKKCLDASKILDKKEETGYWVEAQLKLAHSYKSLKKKDKAVDEYKRVLKMNEYNNSYNRAKAEIKKIKEGK